MSITIDDRKNFVEGVTKLSLWLSSKYTAEGMEFEKAITKATPIYRFTILWDGINHSANGYYDKEWDELLAKLEEKIIKTKTTEQFEIAGLEILNPYIEPRYRIDVEAWPWIPSALGTTNFEERLRGMFLYELTEENELDLHMGNIYAPNSPFKNLKLLKKSLLLLLEDVKKKESNVEQIVCDSWMNSFEPFLSLFPQEWCKNFPITNMKNYTYNIWGQMMNRKGGYNEPNGKYLRKNGSFPYPSLKCSCSIETLQQHLQN